MKTIGVLILVLLLTPVVVLNQDSEPKSKPTGVTLKFENISRLEAAEQLADALDAKLEASDGIREALEIEKTQLEIKGLDAGLACLLFQLDGRKRYNVLWHDELHVVEILSGGEDSAYRDRQEVDASVALEEMRRDMAFLDCEPGKEHEHAQTLREDDSKVKAELVRCFNQQFRNSDLTDFAISANAQLSFKGTHEDKAQVAELLNLIASPDGGDSQTLKSYIDYARDRGDLRISKGAGPMTAADFLDLYEKQTGIQASFDVDHRDSDGSDHVYGQLKDCPAGEALRYIAFDVCGIPSAMELGPLILIGYPQLEVTSRHWGFRVLDFEPWFRRVAVDAEPEQKMRLVDDIDRVLARLEDTHFQFRYPGVYGMRVAVWGDAECITRYQAVVDAILRPVGSRPPVPDESTTLILDPGTTLEDALPQIASALGVNLLIEGLVGEFREDTIELDVANVPRWVLQHLVDFETYLYPTFGATPGVAYLENWRSEPYYFGLHIGACEMTDVIDCGRADFERLELTDEERKWFNERDLLSSVAYSTCQMLIDDDFDTSYFGAVRERAVVCTTPYGLQAVDEWKELLKSDAGGRSTRLRAQETAWEKIQAVELSVDFGDKPVLDCAAWLSEKLGLTVHVTSHCRHTLSKETLTLSLSNARATEVLDAITESGEMRWDLVGSVVVLRPDKGSYSRGSATGFAVYNLGPLLDSDTPTNRRGQLNSISARLTKACPWLERNSNTTLVGSRLTVVGGMREQEQIQSVLEEFGWKAGD